MAARDRADLRFALLQVRNATDPVRGEERLCFATQLGVDQTQVVTVDVLTETLGPQTLEGFDALLVGGSGEYSVVDAVPPVRRMIDFCGEVAEQNFPTFASCFGFQALTLALGGEVITDAERGEVGTFELERTDDAVDDPLFCSLPTRFFAQEGHKDRATRLPQGATCLARSERAPFQALRWKDHDVWATQFHPEMTDADNRLRVERYSERYRKEGEEALASSRPSVEANDLLKRFVDLLRER
jgi:GMP synthase (glutamine-hydrolysing)